jgi:hypothetical protein
LCYNADNTGSPKGAPKQVNKDPKPDNRHRVFFVYQQLNRKGTKMNLPTQPERGTEQPSEGLPIPKLETPLSDSSPSSVDTDAIVRQVTENLRRDLRMAQSTKDKNAELVRKTPGISDLAELEAMGATIPDNVKQEYRFRQLEQQRPADNSPDQKPSSPGNGAALTAQDVTEVVKKFQLDANDADVIGALRGTYRNRDHFEATLANMALARVNRPQPSAAESTTIQSGSASTNAVDVDRLNAELIELSKAPSKNMKRIQEIGEILKKAG